MRPPCAFNARPSRSKSTRLQNRQQVEFIKAPACADRSEGERGGKGADASATIDFFKHLHTYEPYPLKSDNTITLLRPPPSKVS